MRLDVPQAYACEFLAQIEGLTALQAFRSVRAEAAERQGCYVTVPTKTHHGDQFCIDLFGVVVYGENPQLVLSRWKTRLLSSLTETASGLPAPRPKARNHGEEIAQLIAEHGTEVRA